MSKRYYDYRCQITDYPVKNGGEGKATTGCSGLIERREKVAYSFGQQFTSHAYLCDAHADKLGYFKSVPAE